MSRRADQGPKTIEQIHKEAKIEEQEEQRKVQQLMTKEKRRPGKVRASIPSFCVQQRESHTKEKAWVYFPEHNEQRDLGPGYG